jgi:hypothetical protein
MQPKTAKAIKLSLIQKAQARIDEIENEIQILNAEWTDLEIDISRLRRVKTRGKTSRRRQTS